MNAWETEPFKIFAGTVKSPLENHMPVTHDFGSDSKRYWGHDYYIDKTSDDYQIVQVFGWHCGLETGDYLIFQMADDSTTRYKIISLGYFDNPSDNFLARCEFEGA